MSLRVKFCDDHEFTPRQSYKQGCLICLRKYNNVYQKGIRQKIMDFLNDHRLDSGCVQCGYNSNYAALQFDHIVPEALGFRKKRRTSLPRSMAEAIRFVNDENIQVLCANCHCIKTRENKDYLARSNA